MYIQIPDGFIYKSWIKLEEDANVIISKLQQNDSYIHIKNSDDVYINNVVIFDVGFNDSPDV